MNENNLPKFKFAIKEGLSDIYLPTRATNVATGWDVRCAEKELIVFPGEYVKIPLGFRMFAPPGWWAELRPRSSSFAKKSLHALYGVIDEDYEGELIFVAKYLPVKPPNSIFHDSLVIKEGEAIGQIIPVKRQEMIVERVSNEEYEKLCQERNASRGSGGFGSTS